MIGSQVHRTPYVSSFTPSGASHLDAHLVPDRSPSPPSRSPARATAAASTAAAVSDEPLTGWSAIPDPTDSFVETTAKAPSSATPTHKAMSTVRLAYSTTASPEVRARLRFLPSRRSASVLNVMGPLGVGRTR